MFWKGGLDRIVEDAAEVFASGQAGEIVRSVRQGKTVGLDRRFVESLAGVFALPGLESALHRLEGIRVGRSADVYG